MWDVIIDKIFGVKFVKGRIVGLDWVYFVGCVGFCWLMRIYVDFV